MIFFQIHEQLTPLQFQIANREYIVDNMKCFVLKIVATTLRFVFSIALVDAHRILIEILYQTQEGNARMLSAYLSQRRSIDGAMCCCC